MFPFDDVTMRQNNFTDIGSFIIKRVDVLLQDLVKSQSREIQVWTSLIAVKSDKLRWRLI